MTEHTQSERMAVLETTVKNLDEKVTDIQTDVKAIIQTLAKQPSIEAKILNLESEIFELRKRSDLWNWLSPTLTGLTAAILGSVITFLIISYLNNL